NCRRRMEANPLRVLDCKVPECRAVTEDAPRLTDHLSPEARRHFDKVLAGLTLLGVPCQLNHRLVRGLDYYTLTAFEVTSSQLGAQNAVGAGGRYDGLVEALGGPKTPAIGFAVGLERVMLMLPQASVPSVQRPVYIAAFGERGSSAGLALVDGLRSLYSIILGDEEVSKDSLILRNMDTKQQEGLPLKSAARTIASRYCPPGARGFSG